MTWRGLIVNPLINRQSGAAFRLRPASAGGPCAVPNTLTNLHSEPRPKVAVCGPWPPSFIAGNGAILIRPPCKSRIRRHNMPMNRRELLTASVAGAAILKQGRKAFAAPPYNIQVAIDAAKTGEPINPMIFGGYMEPATTRVWSEMLTDRKFANPITSAAAAPRLPPRTPRCAALVASRSDRLGPAGTVEMDTARPFVGKHSPRVKLAGSEPRGIQQSRLRLRHGQVVYRPGLPCRRSRRQSRHPARLGTGRRRLANHHRSRR